MIGRPRKYGVQVNQLMSSSEIMAENRILNLVGPIRSDTLEIRDDLRLLSSESKDPIKIELITPGGEISVALALYHTIASLNQSGTPVYTIGHACYSAGALLLAAGKRGYRYIYPGGTAMIHAASVFVMGSVSQADLEILRKHDRILIDLICKLCDKSSEERDEIYRKAVEERKEFWFDAKEAKEFGLVDHIITPEIDRELFGNIKIPSSWEEIKEMEIERRLKK